MPDDSSADNLEFKDASEMELRQKFNGGLIWEKVTSGEFHWVRISCHVPKSPDEPPGTESLIISIRDSEEREISRAHMYLRPDKSIGGKGGKPDPKQVREGNIIFKQARRRKVDP